MRTHGEKAAELFKRGYNCSQAVFSAFCDETGLDFETSVKLASSFGGGMGRLREVCGAVSGVFMVAGIKYGYTDITDKPAKTMHYRRIQYLAEKFKEENGSIICRELLGKGNKADSPIPENRTEQYYKKRPCIELVTSAANILDEFINNTEGTK